MPTPAFIPPAAHDAPLPPARAAAAGTRVLPGVPYAALPGIRPLELDVWLPPESRTPSPAVLFLHGGGWRAGSRHLAGPAFSGAQPTPFEQLARAGIAVASADYRLSGEARWPAQLHDVKAAVRWLRARAGELGIDGERIAAWGESAGGHLAELLGLTMDDPALEGGDGRARLRLQILKPRLAHQHFAHDQDRPAVADQTGRMRDGAQRVVVITVSRDHLSPPLRLQIGLRCRRV